MQELINYPGSKVDPTGETALTALIDADSIIYIVGWQNKENDDAGIVADVVDRFITDILIVTQARQFAGFFSDKRTFRHTAYPAYKANRKAPDPGIAKWKPYITEYCKQNWGFVLTEGAEADDAVATLQKNMLNSTICSPDKDLKQIPGNHYDYKTGRRVYIEEEQGIYNWAFQMLKGDSGDNIKGIPRVGDVAAKKLIGEPGLVDADLLQEIVQKAYHEKFGNLDEYNLHCMLIGMGDDSVTPYLSALQTFNLAEAAPSDYLRQQEELSEAEDIFGS